MIVGLIPARSGSKRIKDKNTRLLGGYPLMAWSIACAKMCGLPAYVSSESKNYLEVAQRYGGIPHLRGNWAATDDAKDVAVISDFTENVICDSIMLLRPTTPLRSCTFVELMIQAYSYYPAHWVSLCKMRDGDFYRNTGYCEIFPANAFGKDKMGFIQAFEVGEIDSEEDFDYIEWRLQKYGSEIWTYLKNFEPIRA